MPSRKDPSHSSTEAGRQMRLVRPNREKLLELRERKREELGVGTYTEVQNEFLDESSAITTKDDSSERESGKGIWNNAFSRKDGRMFLSSLGRLAAFFGVSVNDLLAAQDTDPAEVADAEIVDVRVQPPPEVVLTLQPVSAGVHQTIVARRGSRVSDVKMTGGTGSQQDILAEDSSIITHAHLVAAQLAQQALRAEGESEISDVELHDGSAEGGTKSAPEPKGQTSE
jgi:hypothetical protein